MTDAVNPNAHLPFDVMSDSSDDEPVRVSRSITMDPLAIIEEPMVVKSPRAARVFLYRTPGGVSFKDEVERQHSMDSVPFTVFMEPPIDKNEGLEEWSWLVVSNDAGILDKDSNSEAQTSDSLDGRTRDKNKQHGNPLLSFIDSIVPGRDSISKLNKKNSALDMEMFNVFMMGVFNDLNAYSPQIEFLNKIPESCSLIMYRYDANRNNLLTIDISDVMEHENSTAEDDSAIDVESYGPDAELKVNENIASDPTNHISTVSVKDSVVSDNNNQYSKDTNDDARTSSRNDDANGLIRDVMAGARTSMLTDSSLSHRVSNMIQDPNVLATHQADTDIIRALLMSMLPSSMRIAINDNIFTERVGSDDVYMRIIRMDIVSIDGGELSMSDIETALVNISRMMSGYNARLSFSKNDD